MFRHGHVSGFMLLFQFLSIPSAFLLTTWINVAVHPKSPKAWYPHCVCEVWVQLRSWWVSIRSPSSSMLWSKKLTFHMMKAGETFVFPSPSLAAALKTCSPHKHFCGLKQLSFISFSPQVISSVFRCVVRIPAVTADLQSFYYRLTGVLQSVAEALNPIC